MVCRHNYTLGGYHDRDCLKKRGKTCNGKKTDTLMKAKKEEITD